VPKVLPNIVFRASAGTGKTYQLTELYTALILGDGYELPSTPEDVGAASTVRPDTPVAPDRILLMTFTENAAAELRLRVEHRLQQHLYESRAAGDSEREDLIRRRLRQIQWAEIGTIHSFCARFLRERAPAGNVSPRFDILEGAELEQERGRVFYEVLARRIGTSPELAELVVEYGPNEVRRLGETAARAMDLGLIPEGVSVAGKWMDSCLPPDVAALKNLLDAALAAQKKPDGVVRAAEAAWNVFQNGGSPGSREFRDAVIGIGAAQQSVSKKPETADLQMWAVRFLARTNYRKYLDAFIEYTLEAREEFRRHRRFRGMLDFDDLIVLATRLLREMPDDEAAALYDVIMVDEVQDVSRLQYHLLRRLWAPGRNSLVICGDAKQSIYGWRDADVQVFRDLENDVRQAETDSGHPAHIVFLRTSYRSHPALVRSINAIAGAVYGRPSRLKEKTDSASAPASVYLPYDYEPEALESAWTEDGGEDGGAPRVELLVPEEAQGDCNCGNGAGETAGAYDPVRWVETEAEAVAYRILLLVEPSTPEWRPRALYADGEWKDAADLRCRFRDICILLRRTTFQPLFEEALRRHGIPYIVAGRGRGFFQRIEVRDMCNLLHALLDPRDPVPLLAVLRSPFASLSDPAIYALAGGGAGGRVRAADLAAFFAGEQFDEERVAALAPGDREACRRTFDLLQEGRRLAGVLGVADLARRMVEISGYDAILAGSARGDVRLANLRKLLDWIALQERTGLNTLSDIVRMLRDKVDSDDEEPEAPLLDPSQDVVRIMTVHAAKGLTTGVVFVPDIRVSRRPQRDLRHFGVDENGRFQASLRLPPSSEMEELGNGIARNWRIETDGIDGLRARCLGQGELEFRNLFYVAVTRARDLVVLSGAPAPSRNQSSQDSWWQWIEDVRQDLGEASSSVIRVVGYHAVVEAGEPFRPAPEKPAIPDLQALESAARVRTPLPEFENRPAPVFAVTQICRAYLASRSAGAGGRRMKPPGVQVRACRPASGPGSRRLIPRVRSARREKRGKVLPTDHGCSTMTI